MKFSEYYISDNNGKSNCVIRTFCKMFNEDYDSVKNELCSISNRLNCSFNDIETFEEYMKIRGFLPIEYGKDIMIKDLKLDSDNYVVFCYDKKDFYHMIPIINNTVYDKEDNCLDLYTITIYKKQ